MKIKNPELHRDTLCFYKLKDLYKVKGSGAKRNSKTQGLCREIKGKRKKKPLGGIYSCSANSKWCPTIRGRVGEKPARAVEVAGWVEAGDGKKIGTKRAQESG